MYARLCLPGEPSLWLPATAGWVYTLLTDDIQRQIVRKEKVLQGYDGELKEVWLLIVADGLAFVELSDEATVYEYQARFDRVIFLDAFRRTCTSFKVHRVDLGAASSPNVA